MDEGNERPSLPNHVGFVSAHFRVEVGLLHLEDDVCPGKQVLDVLHDRPAGLPILLVGAVSSLSGPGLDQDVESHFHIGRDVLREGRDPSFPLQDLLGYSDDHCLIPLCYKSSNLLRVPPAVLANEWNRPHHPSHPPGKSGEFTIYSLRGGIQPG